MLPLSQALTSEIEVIRLAGALVRDVQFEVGRRLLSRSAHPVAMDRSIAIVACELGLHNKTQWDHMYSNHVCFWEISLLILVSDEFRDVVEEATALLAGIPGRGGAGLVGLGRDQLQEVLFGQAHLRESPKVKDIK